VDQTHSGVESAMPIGKARLVGAAMCPACGCGAFPLPLANRVEAGKQVSRFAPVARDESIRHGRYFHELTSPVFSLNLRIA
jgi:hypothetical protein